MSEAKHLLELAVAQFTGWNAFRNGSTIVGLVNSMGLEEHEWRKLKENGDVKWLDPVDIEDIDAHFSNTTPNSRRRHLKSTEGLEP